MDEHLLKFPPHSGRFARVSDALLGSFRWYRKARGGKWEHETATYFCPVAAWVRVEVFRPKALPAVVGREDYR